MDIDEFLKDNLKRVYRDTHTNNTATVLGKAHVADGDYVFIGERNDTGFLPTWGTYLKALHNIPDFGYLAQDAFPKEARVWVTTIPLEDLLNQARFIQVPTKEETLAKANATDLPLEPGEVILTRQGETAITASHTTHGVIIKTWDFYSGKWLQDQYDQDAFLSNEILPALRDFLNQMVK